jgi:hypothetical protein
MLRKMPGLTDRRSAVVAFDVPSTLAQIRAPSGRERFSPDSWVPRIRFGRHHAACACRKLNPVRLSGLSSENTDGRRRHPYSGRNDTKGAVQRRALFLPEPPGQRRPIYLPFDPQARNPEAIFREDDRRRHGRPDRIGLHRSERRPLRDESI